MTKVLILGSTGMLGSAVKKFYDFIGFEVVTNKHRWPTEDFKKEILDFNGELILNCIGGVHQNYNGRPDFYNVNFELPVFLAKHSKAKIIHPDTDCVFSGGIPKDKKYKKEDEMDAKGDYAESKVKFAKILNETEVNLKVLRTSIIGFDKNKVSLLSWFLSQEGKCKGFDFHYWNGLTTFQWAKESLKIYLRWNSLPRLVQLAPDSISKYDLLSLFAKVFNRNVEIERVSSDKVVNKCLETDWEVPTLEDQLIEFRRLHS